MKRISFAVSIIIFAGLALAAVSAPIENKQTIGTVEINGWKTLKMSETRVETSGGRTHLRNLDGQFEAKAGSVKVLLNKPKTASKQLDIDAVSSAELQGDVWIISRPKPGFVTEARADKAHIDWVKKVAKLEGKVSIESTDPTIFDKPSKLKGDSATILLGKDLGPDEYRVTIESNPERSYVEVTPKAKEQKDTKSQ